MRQSKGTGHSALQTVAIKVSFEIGLSNAVLRQAVNEQ